jgi:hypothetical protein
MIVAMLAIPAAAEDTVNYEEEFKYTKKAPKVDGKVDKGEYGTRPVHSFKDAKDQFIYGTKAGHEHDGYDESDWDVDFYAAWDEENLYMAWVVNTEVHVGMPEQDYNNDGAWNVEGDSNYMWEYSCLQFILTPGAPESGVKKYQTAEWSGDYLEVGLALTAENNAIRAWWSKPTLSQSLDVNDWDAAIERDDAKKTTIYEVRIPWNKSGVDAFGDGAQFGLTYAVAAQEYKVKRGMIEWQDGCLGGKNADNAAVITLTGNKDVPIQENSKDAPTENKTEGTLPEAAKDAIQLGIDGVNISISGEKAYLYTDPSVIGENNNTWATSILLKPVEGDVYEIVETKTGNGATFSFDSEIEDGMIAFSVHSDGSGVGKERSELARALGVGDKLGLFGVDLEKADTTYSNAMFYVIGGETEDPTTSEDVSEEVSEDVSTETSEDANTSTETSEDANTSTDASTATSEDADASTEASTATSEGDATADEEGSLLWLWIVIGVVVVAGVVVAVVVVSKKK